jgi:hypothetical protein
MDVQLTSEEERQKFSKAWIDLKRAVAVHMDMEEIDMFPLLEKISPGSVSNAGLSDLHVSDHERSHEVDEHISAGNIDWEALGQAWAIWKTSHLEHFAKEESVMMPATVKTSPTAEGRCMVVHEKLVTPAEARDLGELKYYVGWCVGKLSKHGSSEQPPAVATRVFIRALRSACLKPQWLKLMPSCKAQCDPTIWTEMEDKYSVEEADDAHLIPIKLSRAIIEANLDELPMIALPASTTRPKSSAPPKQTVPKEEMYQCNCSIM